MVKRKEPEVMAAMIPRWTNPRWGRHEKELSCSVLFFLTALVLVEWVTVS